MANAKPCSICNGIFHHDSEGQLFCLTCLNQWLDGENATGCQFCHVQSERFQWLKCTRPSMDGECDAFDFNNGNYGGMCSTHQQLQHFYCHTCKKAACQICVTYTHEKKLHKITSVADVCPQQRQFTKDMREILSTRLEKAKEHIATIENSIKTLCTCVGLAEIELDELAARMIQEIKSNADSVKKRLKLLQKTKTEELKHEKLKADILAQDMQKSLHETAKCLDTFPDHMYVSQHTDINENMLKLCIEQQHLPDDISGSVKFVPNLTCPDLSLGQLMHRRTLHMVEQIGDFKKISAVSGSPEGHLAICDQKLKDVTVFRCGNMDEICLQRCLKDCQPPSKGAGNFETPIGLGFSGSRDLLLSNLSKLSLFDVESNNFVGVISRFNTVEIRKMAVINDQEVVVSDAKSKEIHVMNPLGQILRTFQIPYAASTSLASNGRKVAFANQKYGKVCIMSIYTGEVICEVDIPRVSSACFDDSSLSLLATRNTVEMGVVEQYCSNSGARIGVLATGLDTPIDVSLLGTNHLVVAHKKYVKIFKIC